MDVRADLAQLRAWMKLLHDLSYRLEAAVDRVEEAYQEEKYAAANDVGDPTPF